MSYEADTEDEDNASQVDENQQGGTGLGNGQAENKSQSQTDISLGGGGGVSTPGAPTAQTMGSSTGKPSSSGSWTNLQSYLDANQDQAGQLGSQVTGAVSSQADKAQNDITNASNDFQGQVDQNTVNQDQPSVDRAIADAQNAKAGGTYDPNELAAFQKQYGANYSGPTDFTQSAGYGQTQGDVNQALDSLNSVKSEAGRNVLLQNQFGANGGYSPGEKSLDQLLLEGSPTNQAAFSGLQDQWSGLGTALSGATDTGNQYAQTAAQTSAATAKAAQDALTKANTDWQGGLNSQLSTAQQSYQSENDAIKAALTAGTLTHDQLAATGLQGGMTTMGLDLSKYLSPGTNPTIYNAATADQYAQSQALAQLAGAGGTSYLPQEYASQAGSAGSPWSYNAGQFTSDRNAAIGAYNGALSNTTVNPAVGGPMSLKDWLGAIPMDNSSADWSGPIQQAIAKLNEVGKNYGQGDYYLQADPLAPAGYDLSQQENDWAKIKEALK